MGEEIDKDLIQAFFATPEVRKFARRAVLRMILSEQGKPAPEPVPIQGDRTPAGNDSSAKLGKRYQPGEVLIQQGELGEQMFVIQSGQVALMQAREGEEVFVGVRGEGEILGEMALFDQQAHNATVKALSEVVAITLDKQNFNKRIHEDPSMAFHLFQLMTRRTRELSQQVTMLNQEIDRLTEGT